MRTAWERMHVAWVGLREWVRLGGLLLLAPVYYRDHRKWRVWWVCLREWVALGGLLLLVLVHHREWRVWVRYTNPSPNGARSLREFQEFLNETRGRGW